MFGSRHRNDSADARQTPEHNAPDAELVVAARRGDKRAFVEIVARHQAMVCGIALGILGDFGAGEDAGQEAFLTAWRKIHELRDPERLRFWLAQIARNAALGHLRRRRGRDNLECGISDLASTATDESVPPDEAAANHEEAALVRAALAKLPETYRLPLILYYREGQSVRGVAEALGVSEDAVKQRLARGREMLRDRVSGVIETVLTRPGPTAIFTMTIAAAIGALAAPAAVAGTVFAATSVAGATSSSAVSTASTPVLTAMSTSKTLFIAAAVVTAVFIPVGYYVGSGIAPTTQTEFESRVQTNAHATRKSAPIFENSLLFAEWRQLHDTHGRTSEAMPALYKAIADIKDPFRRRAFRAALIAEWVQVDPPGGFVFFCGKGPDETQRRQFFGEWLARDPRAAVDALMAARPGWEEMARESLPEIARRVPSRLAEIVSRLPKSDRFYDAKVQDAFGILAENGLVAARTAAEGVAGPNRNQALGGVARVWARSDLDGAIAWAKDLPEGTDRDEVIRNALVGKARVDPVAALEQVGSVPSGGRHLYASSTTGARVLLEAAKTDFDATVAWLGNHPGRLGREDLEGLSDAVTERLNMDAKGFLTKHATEGSLSAILPALGSAILNNGAGQRAVVWDWLKTQPNNDSVMTLRKQVLNAAGFHDPELAIRMVNDLPRTTDADALVESVASCLLNGGSMLYRFDKVLAQASDRLRQPLFDAAFRFLRADNVDDPQRWIARLSQLPESSRAGGVASIARAWAQQTPEEAVGWANSLSPGEARNGAVAAIASTWGKKDAYGAAEWVGSISPGPERDRSAESLVYAVAEKYPREAWDWALSIGNADQRNRAAIHVANTMAARDPATARQWIDAGPFTAEAKAQLQAALAQRPK